MTKPGRLSGFRSIAEYESSGETFVVAEVGQAHDGSVGILHSYIDAAAEAGVDAIKFQTHLADAESSADEPFRTKFSYVDATRYDYWKRMQLTEAQWTEVFEHCQRAGIEFMATPFSNAAVDLLERVGTRRYKVGSGDIANNLLLEKIARTKKEVIISTGLGDMNDIDQAISLFQEQKVPVSVLQCTTRYPTEAKDINLQMILELKQRFGIPVGLSDHSGTIYAGLSAAALGASVVEVHMTFDRRMFGPDSKSSLSVDELANLAEGIKFINAARTDEKEKILTDETKKLKDMFGKSLAVNQDLPAGHVIKFEDLEAKKPARQGISPVEFKSVVGRVLKVPKACWEFLKEDDLK